LRIENIVYFITLAFPIVLLTVKPLAIILFGLLSIWGIFSVIRNRLNPFVLEGSKIFSWLSIFYFIVMSLSVILSNEPTNSWTHLSRISYFLLGPFVALAIVRANIPPEKMLIGLKLGTIVSGIIVLSQFTMADSASRFSGLYNTNTFGDLVLMQMLFAMSYISYEKGREYWLTLCAVSFGSIALVISSSRGSILSFVLLVLLYTVLMYVIPRYYKTHGWTAIGVALFFFIVTITTTGMLSNRFNVVQNEASAWSKGEKKVTSVGIRLEMYRTGWSAFKDAPIIGYGFYNCCKAAARYVDNDLEAEESIRKKWHLHNEVITTMVNAGILGLLALFGLYFIPLYLFLKRIKVERYALMGVMLIFGYIFNGFTHTLFGYEYETAFFVVMLSWILSQIKTKGKSSVL